MNRRAVLPLGLLLLAAAAACASDPAPDEAPPVDETSDEQDVKALLLGEESDGKTVQVVAGRSFTVALEDNRASSGYAWTVTSAPASLGAPKVAYLAPPSSRLGASGVARFTWKTTGAVEQVGMRTITFALARSWEPAKPSRTITITVELLDGAQAKACGGLAGVTCNGAKEYCDYPVTAACGAADRMGTCQPRPDVCNRHAMLVCGCDGKTYGNPCLANAAGVSVRASGACK